MRLIIIGGPDAMKTAIEKPVTPGGVFDHLMVPQGDEPEFHSSKDPKTMTVQESLEEVDRFLCWNRRSGRSRRHRGRPATPRSKPPGISPVL